MPQRAASSRVAGSVSAAALFATWRAYRPAYGSVAGGTARAGRGRTLVGLGGREMGHQAHDGAARRGQLGEAPPAHARVELEVDGTPSGSRPSATSARARPRAPRRPRPPRSGRARGSARPGRPRAAERLGHGRDAERGRAAFERGAADVDRAVPVAVGLDDRPELPRRRARRAGARCAGPRRGRSSRASGSRPHSRVSRGGRDGQDEDHGSAAATSEATRPAWFGTARAARPWATAAAAAASTGSRPFARNAPTTPVRRRPSPQSRARGPGVADDRAAVGRATIVSAPFSRTTAAKRSARGRPPRAGGPRPTPRRPRAAAPPRLRAV